jgi:quercetin dioxygenase-like cupin family protein
MKRTLAILTLAGLSLTAVAVRAAAPAAPAPVILTPDAIKWVAGTGDMKMVKIAILYGDPTKAGSQYAVRYKIPDGTSLPPHMHGGLEQVTVLSGSFLVGLGKTVDASKMQIMPAGSFAAIPPNVAHYAKTKGETVLEVHGIGPATDKAVK